MTPLSCALMSKPEVTACRSIINYGALRSDATAPPVRCKKLPLHHRRLPNQTQWTASSTSHIYTSLPVVVLPLVMVTPVAVPPPVVPALVVCAVAEDDWLTAAPFTPRAFDVDCN